ncbi:Kinesin- protein 12 [Thoreauomyces humboldtii]|nr:Kinesin- protein 12 [Thoreauomyces humboldtii]
MEERGMTFNYVFDDQSSQTDVFEQCGVKDLVDKALEGYATTVFAFGQTGSGKSFTVTGEKGLEFDSNQGGIVLRSLRYLYEQAARDSRVTYSVKAAYLEIYNEHVQDLMSLTNTVSLPVRFQASRGFYVENLLVLDCHTIDDCIAVMQEGLKNRTTRAHQLNEHSSRSHSIMTIYIDSEQPEPAGGRPFVKHGKMSFVDLAGSEKVRETKATGESFNEMLNINKSLLTLGNCISALSDARKRTGHIPYRDSNLTRLLADSLGGSGLALMIACVSPSPNHINETLKTLRYAQRTKRIKNRPVVNMDPRDELVETLTAQVTQLRIENEYLKSMVLGGAASASGSGYGSPRVPSAGLVHGISNVGPGVLHLPRIAGASPVPNVPASAASSNHWRQSTSGSVAASVASSSTSVPAQSSLLGKGRGRLRTNLPTPQTKRGGGLPQASVPEPQPPPDPYYGTQVIPEANYYAPQQQQYPPQQQQQYAPTYYPGGGYEEYPGYPQQQQQQPMYPYAPPSLPTASLQDAQHTRRRIINDVNKLDHKIGQMR